MPTRRTFVVLAAATVASACTALPAQAVGSLVDVRIVDRSRGDVLSTWRHRGTSYVAGQPGDRYAVRLTNRTGGRVLVVLSVDGVNAVSGETAAVGQTGYVLAAHQSAEITGWRKSQTEAAAFYFTALPDSYAARTQRPDNVGVIGAAVFRERVPEPVMHWREQAPPLASGSAANGAAQAEKRARSDADAPRSAAAAPSPLAERAESMDRLTRDSIARSERLGTGHGEREYSPTSQTAFERASSQPAEVVQVRYDSHSNLLASGVIPRARPMPRVPQPFPSFVPDPA
ncbi:MAG TPA: hypothetical protein VHM00_16995 [Caldimonas sp.]|jgi:hypothetical protein|nr:hypothetical protein [Caldimonas sp.]HEX2542769.1 hypothetical protein [Caldimonas sp.]